MTKASNRSSAVTQFWYMLEQLTPFDLTGATKNEKFKAEILNTEEDLKLPWLNPEMLTQQFKLPASKNGKPQEYDYQVYLGVFPSVSVTEFIQSLPKDADVGFEETFPTRGDSCYASFKIGADGLLEIGRAHV